MSLYRDFLKARDRIAERLGWVRRPVQVPPADGTSVEELRERLGSQSHDAMLKRIKGG